MARVFLTVLAVLGFGLLVYFGRYVPDAEQVTFDKKFDREAIFMKTCGSDPSIASGAPLKVYRFEDKLWFEDIHRWRQVEGNIENVCDLLDIAKGHEPPPPVLRPGWSPGG